MRFGLDSSSLDVEDWRTAFTDAAPESSLHATADLPPDSVDVLLLWQPQRLDWRAATALRRVFALGAGVDHLSDLQLPEGVELERLHDAGMADAMADYALYATLHFQRDFDAYRRSQARGEWRSLLASQSPAQTQVTVLGLGNLGSAVAARLARHGYAVSGWARTVHRVPGVRCASGEEALLDLLAATDVLINVLPLTPATHGLLNAARLGRLPRDAAFINLSRGAVVDQSDLLALLDEGRLRGAFLDVTAVEPLPSADPLWRHPRVWLTPHVSAPTDPRLAAQEIVSRLAH
ncbi:MAG: glyoxylate/hydroxypyruvate reductase A [Pseudomonadota bacterium]